MSLPPLQRHAKPSVRNIELWPAKTDKTQQYRFMVKSPSHQAVSVKQAIWPKPKLLILLEEYLEKELRILQCPNKGPHELRLQAHREVFEMLVQEFKTYKPLLSAIKNEYDLYVSYQSEKINKLQPIKDRLYSIEYTNKEAIQLLKQAHEKEKDNLRQNCAKLNKTIEHYQQEHMSYQEQITKLQTEMTNIYKDYRDVADARKLLLNEVSELQTQLSEKEKLEELDIDPEYHAMLKMKLMRAKEDLRHAHAKLTKLSALYVQVVPKEEHDSLKDLYSIVEDDAHTLGMEYANLTQEHSTVISLLKRVEEEKDLLENELTELKETIIQQSYQPDWSSYVFDFDKWKERGTMCKNVFDNIETCSLKPSKNFIGQGVVEEVPHYLKTNDCIVNKRQMSRAEMEEIVSGFWKYILIIGTDARPIDVIFSEYLKLRNNGRKKKAIEDGYNLHDCFGKYINVVHIKVFMKTLSGEFTKEVYKNWIATQNQLINQLRTQQSNVIIPVNSFEECVRQVLCYKEESFVKSLLQCAMKTARETDGINVIKLVDKGPDKEPSQFARMLLEQRIKETKDYATSIITILQHRQKGVTLNEIATAMQEYDSYKSNSQIQSIVTELFGQDMPVKVTIEVVAKKIEGSNIIRDNARSTLIVQE